MSFLEESHFSVINCLAYVSSSENYSWDFQSCFRVKNLHPRWKLHPTIIAKYSPIHFILLLSRKS